MTLLLYGAATCVMITCGILYYNGCLLASAMGGIAYAGLAGAVLVRSTATWVAVTLIALFAAAPTIYLVVHAIDARRGIFLLPTIYSIPIAFVCSLILWGCAGLGMLL